MTAAARAATFVRLARPVRGRRPAPWIGDGPLELTSKQRAHLRSLAHPLKAIVMVGKEGITDATVQSLEEAFRTRELLKVKVQEAAPLDVREAADTLVGRLENTVSVQTIGRVAVLYRPHPETPEIRLPS